MHTVIYEEGEKVSIPIWVADLASFRRWAASDDFPESGRIWWLQGEVCADMSKQQIFSHVMVKTRIAAVLSMFAEKYDRGLFFGDGVFFVNEEADIAGVPDSVFISNETLESRTAQFVEGADSGYTELVGSPDMVLEVVSKSSVEKDTVLLKHAYWQAGVREYWLVDARNEPVQFDLYRHTPRGYVATRGKDGWLKSNVYGKSFRVVADIAATPKPKFSFEMR